MTLPIYILKRWVETRVNHKSGLCRHVVFTQSLFGCVEYKKSFRSSVYAWKMVFAGGVFAVSLFLACFDAYYHAALAEVGPTQESDFSVSLQIWVVFSMSKMWLLWMVQIQWENIFQGGAHGCDCMNPRDTVLNCLPRLKAASAQKNHATKLKPNIVHFRWKFHFLYALMQMVKNIRCMVFKCCLL